MRFLSLSLAMELAVWMCAAPPQAPQPKQAPAVCPCADKCDCPAGVCPACPAKASGVVTYTRKIHPDTTGRPCLWDWPNDSKAKPVFLGYVTQPAANCVGGVCTGPR